MGGLDTDTDVVWGTVCVVGSGGDVIWGVACIVGSVGGDAGWRIVLSKVGSQTPP
jgi:hypothetical protein